eukprot:m.257699 g.257699  ORF g.257699 m.257699 type:complete len:303 (+) comp26599_c1_seq1:263-1171(+)
MPRRRKRPSSRKPVTFAPIGTPSNDSPTTTSTSPASLPGPGRKGRAGKSTFNPKPHASLIATFHAANKNLAAARQRGDGAEVAALEAQLEGMGGIERYQRNSLKGEDLRSTNTSKWLLKKLVEQGCRPEEGRGPLVLLDVGALRVNYSKVGWIDADAIDLNSQASGITEVDFFDFAPSHRADKRPYDVVALSLVVNFVPEPKKRGEMLRRSVGLLKPGGTLFLVLPRACVDNSRYVTDVSLKAILTSLGLEVTLSHLSAKLAYYVLRLAHPDRHRAPDRAVFKRALLRPGATRNNFSIGLPE